MINEIQKNKTYIGSQLSPDVSHLTYGKAGQTVDKVGCGIVAVYNALLRCGESVDFNDLLRSMEKLRMPWLFGLFGTKPHSLGRVFREYNIPYKKYGSVRHFSQALAKAHAGIVCSWNPGLRGIHFYCVYYSDKEKCIYSLNYYNQDIPTVIDASAFSQKRWIVGYLV